jgi:hypothetical protein
MFNFMHLLQKYREYVDGSEHHARALLVHLTALLLALNKPVAPAHDSVICSSDLLGRRRYLQYCVQPDIESSTLESHPAPSHRELCLQSMVCVRIDVNDIRQQLSLHHVTDCE